MPHQSLYLQHEHCVSVDDLQHMLYQKSGSLGVPCLSADMRVLLASDGARAAKAIELFTFRVAREVAAGL